MAKRWRKRSHDDYNADNKFGMGETLKHLKASTEDSASPDTNGDKPDSRRNSGDEGGAADEGGEWQQVERKSKKRKKLPKEEREKHPSISHSTHARLNSYVKLSDLQNLVLYLLADASSPQWCSVRHHRSVRKVVALMLPGLEMGMFDGSIPLTPSPASDQDKDVSTTADISELAQQDKSKPSKSEHASKPAPSQPVQSRRRSPDDYYPTKLKHDRLPPPLQPLSEMFDHLWPIKTPGDDKYAKMHSPMAAMLVSPITKTKEEKKAKGPRPPPERKMWKNQRTPITEFIATTVELVEEGYVLHPAHYNGTSTAAAEIAKRELNRTTAADGWVDTPSITTLTDGDVPDEDIEKGAILAGRKILALDCEMCITSPTGVTPQQFSLTRISIIDWDGTTILDELVKPDDPITDYLTPYSGITAAKLEGITTTLRDIQQKLVEDTLTPQTILVGHSLSSDLNALQFTHPYIIDTTLLFPHPRGPPLKSSLKWLSQKYLSREIQAGHGSTGHDSLEDARASLDLVKQKCEKGKMWGTSEAGGESVFKRLSRSIKAKGLDGGEGVELDVGRTGAVVDWGDQSRGYGAQAKVVIGCESDAEVVIGIKRALEGDEEMVPKGGVDFVFARLRELEARTGWWTRSKSVDAAVLRDNTQSSVKSASLDVVVAQTIARVREVWDALPTATAFVVFSGSGDPRELARMQAMQAKFKLEYRTKKWDELSVRWTDVEEQGLRRACESARMGVGFLGVK